MLYSVKTRYLDRRRKSNAQHRRELDAYKGSSHSSISSTHKNGTKQNKSKNVLVCPFSFTLNLSGSISECKSSFASVRSKRQNPWQQVEVTHRSTKAKSWISTDTVRPTPVSSDPPLGPWRFHSHFICVSYKIILSGSSTSSLNEANHCAPTAPSMTRWSQASVAVITCAYL